MYVSGTGKEKEEKLADGHGFKGVKRVSGVVQRVRVRCINGKSRPRGGVLYLTFKVPGRLRLWEL